MLQKALDQGNVEAVVLVNLGSIPLAETVGADTLKAKVIANKASCFWTALSVIGKMRSLRWMPLRRQ